MKSETYNLEIAYECRMCIIKPLPRCSEGAILSLQCIGKSEIFFLFFSFFFFGGGGGGAYSLFHAYMKLTARLRQALKGSSSNSYVSGLIPSFKGGPVLKG